MLDLEFMAFFLEESFWTSCILLASVQVASMSIFPKGNNKMTRKSKICHGLSKCVCCSLLNLTMGCRIVASVGIILALWLVIAFANDKFLNNESNYDLSRKTAILLGLDWQHFYFDASIKHDRDPEGKMITIIVIFYSFAFLGLNLLLFVATLRYDWCFALPWLVCEGLSCISKLGSFIYHLKHDPYELGSVYFIGFGFVLVISFWFWFVVLFTLISWRNQQNFNLETEMFTLYNSSSKSQVTQSTLDGSARIHTYKETSVTISPIADPRN